MGYVYAAAAAIILLFITLIFKKRKKVKADYLLIGVNFMIGMFLVSDILVSEYLSSASVIFQNAVPLILFPIFVFYLLQFTHSEKGISPFWYLIYVPSLIFLILSVVDHFILNNYPNPEDVLEHYNDPSIYYQLIFKGSQIMYITVLSFLLVRINRFKNEIKKGYSSIDEIELTWLRNFTLIYLCSIFFTFILFLGQNLSIFPFEVKHIYSVIYGVLILSVFYLNYQGIQHYTIAQISTKTKETGEQEDVLPRASMDETEVSLNKNEQLIEQRMLRFIEDELLYLEPKFSLNELSDYLGENKHTISKIINAKEGRSFYDLINGYRVEHLKRLLNDPKNAQFTILALGLESGFNSKASLNRIFKLHSGLTPKQYLNKEFTAINSDR